LYSIEDRFEVGIMLIGSEVKSIRDGKCSLNEAWVDISENKDELWLVGAHIDEYSFANRFNHIPARRRKLLAHISEIQKMRKAKELKGLTLIPLKLYFKNRFAKLEVGICRGKDQKDKREDVMNRDAKLAVARIAKAARI
jgi:SsrA-binding protein